MKIRASQIGKIMTSPKTKGDLFTGTCNRKHVRNP